MSSLMRRDLNDHADRPRYLFVTGRLAEFALRQVLDRLAPRAGFAAEVAVLPISVAALMTPRWVARHLEVPAGIDQVILPGHCRGDLAPVLEKAVGRPRRTRARGPRRPAPPLRSGRSSRLPSMAPIGSRSWPRSTSPPAVVDEMLAPGPRFRAEGADVIDLGCDPAMRWDGVRRGGRCPERGGASGLDR